MHDDDWPDPIEYDPRWEVQPEPDRDDEPGGRVPGALVTGLVVTALAAALVWLAVGTAPVF